MWESGLYLSGVGAQVKCVFSALSRFTASQPQRLPQIR